MFSRKTHLCTLACLALSLTTSLSSAQWSARWNDTPGVAFPDASRVTATDRFGNVYVAGKYKSLATIRTWIGKSRTLCETSAFGPPILLRSQ
jgi:hypothetical protein